MLHAFRLVLFTLFLVLVAGCGGGSGAPPPENGGEDTTVPDTDNGNDGAGEEPPDGDEPDSDGTDDGGPGDDPPPVAASFTISGTVTASSGTAADGDVNDPYAPVAANDSCEMAQPLPNPVTLGGYLNAPGAGPQGRSRSTGDIDDLYKVSLQAGQTATLYISDDPAANDLDLYLLDADCEVVDASEGTGATESVTAPAAGDYVLWVTVYCDIDDDCGTTATNYNLVIGQNSLAAADPRDRQAEFVPGEVIVRFADTAGILTTAQADSRVQSLGLVRQAGAPGRNMLLRPAAGDVRSAALHNLGITKNPAQAADRLGLALAPGLREELETVAMVRALRARPDVATADLNYVRRALWVPNDSFYEYQWHYPQINLPAAWDIARGDDVIVAVVDTGVLLNHPDLQGQLVAGYDFISDPANALDGDGIDPDPDDPGDQALPGQSSFHGTHVAGTVAARTNNDIGIAGTAPNAKIMPLRVLGKFGGTSYDIQQAILFAAGLPNDSGTVPAKRADIINLSLGGGGASNAEQQVYTQVRGQGVIIVAAAGNDNTATPGYPASYDGVISVSAVDANNARAPYSNYGAYIDVAAPGGDMFQDINGDGYADGVLSTTGWHVAGGIEFGYTFENGTSMAAPHVAGVIALMKGQNPDLTPDDVDTLLAAGTLTDDLGTPGWNNQFGWGLINAFKAVQAAGAPVDPTPVLQATPSGLNFATQQTTLNLELRNIGTAALSVETITDDAAWLTVTPVNVDDDGLGSYAVSVDRSALEPGAYEAKITITSSANDVEVPVIMQVAEAGAEVGGNTGFQWIILVDPDTWDTVDVVSADNENGVYSYQFTNVPAGRYLVFAGSDMNNDDFICDQGESCGAFPTLSKPTELLVEDDVSGVDFVSSYQLGIGAAAATVPRRGLSRTAPPVKQVGQRP